MELVRVLRMTLFTVSWRLALMSMMSLLALTLFAGQAWAAAPVILRVLPFETFDGRVRLQVHTANVEQDAVLLFGGQPLRLTAAPSGNGVYYADLARPEPGFVTVRLRSAGMESNAATVSIPLAGNTQTLAGRALYQKIEVTDSGLELDRNTMEPIRNSRVEVIDRFTRGVLSVSETDNGRVPGAGPCHAPWPDDPGAQPVAFAGFAGPG
jgi:hypothetical protein